MVERRQPKPTVDFIDEYCQYYRNLFSDVRDLQVINCPTVSQNFRAKPRRVVVSLDRATPTVGQFIFWIFLRGFEAFKYLHMGMISEIKRKTLPAIAKVVGLDNHQPLHHFLTVSPWDIKLLRDLQVINCPTVSQNFRAKPRRVVVSLDRATPTVGQFIFWIFLRDLQVINCPTVSQNFRAKPRRVVVSLDRATPTVGQFIFWIFLRDLQVINCPTVSQNFRAKPRRVVVSLDRATPTVGQFIFWIFLRDLQVINCPTVSQNFRAKPRRVVVSLDRATPTVGQFIFWIFLTEIRLQLILDILSGRPIILMIDETGDKKKGKSTDYVKRQYIGNLGKTDNGIVAVTAYAVFCGMTFPLTFEIYKPRERLKEGDKYLTKPQIAAQMIKELQKLGFKFNLVLADSLYGESGKNFRIVLDELELNYLVAIRSNHQAWMPPNNRVQYLKWHRFKRVFSNLNRENRYIRKILKLQPQSDSKFSSHPWWNDKSGWNNILNNLRLILQPFVFFNLIKPWLKVFKIPELYQGFLKLQRIINYFTNSIFSQLDYWDFHFSSA